MSPLLDYTTSVPVSRTAAQIQTMLVEHGARAVTMEYDDKGRVFALAFYIKMPDRDLPIRLPINAAATWRVLQGQAKNRKIPLRFAKEDHAYRVAWRNIYHWISAQLALLETEMVVMEEIFLGYIIASDGQTLFQKLEQRDFLLPLGREDE